MSDPATEKAEAQAQAAIADTPATPTPPASVATPPLTALTRALLWGVIVGGLAAWGAAPIALHVFGPLVAWAVRDPNGALWNPAVSGLSLALSGAAVVLVLSFVVALPPRLAALGVGVGGTLWIALLNVLTGGFASLWASLPGLAARLLLAGAAGAAAYAVAARLARGKRPHAR